MKSTDKGYPADLTEKYLEDIIDELSKSAKKPNKYVVWFFGSQKQLKKFEKMFDDAIKEELKKSQE